MSSVIHSHTDLLKKYAEGPSKLEKFLQEIPEGDFNGQQTPGEWSIREIIHHIVDGDDIWNTCIKAALGNQQGEFSLKWYWDIPQKDWSEQWKYNIRSVENSLALYRANRAHIVELLDLILDSWDRAVHIRWPGDEDLSTISVEEVIKMHVEHLDGHLKDMAAILSVKK